MSTLSKHRLAKDRFAVDFATRLASGEALSGTPTVAVAQRAAAGAWTNVTSEFSVAGIAIEGTEVQFTLGVATGSQQDGGEYYLRVEVDTDAGHHLVSTHRLEVSEIADPDAP